MIVYPFMSALAVVASMTTAVSGFVSNPRRNNVGFVPYSSQSTKRTSLDMSTWSDSKAVMDYQNFLSSGELEPEKKRDGPSVIIQPPLQPGQSYDLADAIVAMGTGDDLVITPFEGLPETSADGGAEYPIYICLPPYQIGEFLRNLPEEYIDRQEDFIFFSGGMDCGNIEDVLKEYGYCRDSMTQVLASGFRLTPAKRVADMSVRLSTVDSNGETKWAGETTACGKWNGAIQERLERSDIRCRCDFYREWRRHMWEQTLYDAVFSVLGSVREEPTTIAEVAEYYGEEVSDVVWEVSAQLRGWKALTLSFGFEERLFGLAEINGSGQSTTSLMAQEYMFPYIWGNRVFLESPTFLEYINYAQKQKGFLPNIELPELVTNSGKPSIMREGNLRADGVI